MFRLRRPLRVPHGRSGRQVVELTADMERQQELWAEAKERADAAEHACNEWTAKTAKVRTHICMLPGSKAECEEW